MVIFKNKITKWKLMLTLAWDYRESLHFSNINILRQEASSSLRQPKLMGFISKVLFHVRMHASNILPLRKKKRNCTIKEKRNHLTNKRVDQLTWDCSILTKVLGSRFGNAPTLNTCWESFVTLMILLDSNLY